jgi:uncharacterized membrane-anchored protein
MLSIPQNYPQRQRLNDEVHARPYQSITSPSRASYLALFADQYRDREYEILVQLCEYYHQPLPPKDTIHWVVDLGDFRLKWERHSEFTSYLFIQQGHFDGHPFTDSVISQLPADWLQQLPGQVMVAAHLTCLKQDDTIDIKQISAWFDDHYLIGTDIGDGAASTFTDFHIHPDGFSRFLLLDKNLTRRQSGRMMQRLFEIEIYRMMALLALPIARQLSPILTRADEQLRQLTQAVSEKTQGDELLLEQLTQLAARIEDSLSKSTYRFTASRAYYALVNRRIEELRETRIQGMQTFREFVDRRLAPAIDTCESTAHRQEMLSKRVNRTSQLLRTRVDIQRQRHNQALLASMDKRAQLQLRLQETVEGLSIVAITYYSVSLIGYIAKSLKTLGVNIDPNLATGIAIPIVALLAAFGVHHIRAAVTGKHHQQNIDL